MRSRILPQKFYARSALDVAPELLGKLFFHRKGGAVVGGRIVEVEAYLGSEDPASHAYKGETPRNSVMFGPAGHAYVYFTYGNHFCVNAVTGTKGVGSAVLIRALEPWVGVPLMERRRKRKNLTHLMSGPGKLTQAMGIGRAENGVSLSGNRLWIESPEKDEIFQIRRTPRIGISRARSKLYRFLVKGSPYVSRYRP